jgi:hypothetical protein
MSQFWQGGLLAIFAFLLAIAWDEYKAYRDAGRRDDALFATAEDEIDAIAATARNDLALVMEDLGLLALDPPLSLENPLDPIESGFWDVMKLNPPRALLRDRATLGKVRDVARRTDQVNEMIRSRETFRSTVVAFSGMSQRLSGYDRLIKRWLEELLPALDELKKTLRAARLQAEQSRPF